MDSYTTAPCRPTSKPTYAAVSDQLHIVPQDQRWYPINQVWISTHKHIVKIWLFFKSSENQQIFSVTLTETLVCWMIRSWVIQVYTIHKRSQSLSVWSIQLLFNVFLKNFIIFSSNWLLSKFSLIYPYRGVKPDTFGDISVFSVFCWDASYLSWEASQQNLVFIILHHLATPNFRDNKIF